MSGVWLHRSRFTKALNASLFSIALATAAQATSQTQLLLQRDKAIEPAEFKGIVELTVDPGFDDGKVAISVDGEKIAPALRSPYKVTVDFGPRVVEHKITVTAWSRDGYRVQWSQMVNRGHLTLTVRLKPVDAADGVFEAVTTAPEDDPITRVELWDSGNVIGSGTTAPYRFTVPTEKLAAGFLQVTAKTKSGEEAADFWSSGGDVHVENVDVRTVPIYVSVVDRDGTTRDDVDRSLFKILDGNAEGKIVEFGKAFDQPISIALLLDASASMTYEMKDSTHAAAEFVNKTLKKGDRCAVYAISTVPRRIVELTTDKDAVSKAVSSIQANGQTALYDGITTALRELRNEKNRRAIVVLTDGGDNASMASFDEAEKTARAAGVPIYFIAYSSGEENAQQDVDRMNFLATETGGFLTAATQANLAVKYAQIEKDLRAQFAILYQVTDYSKHNEWRRVRVMLNSPKLTARTIGGYFAP